MKQPIIAEAATKLQIYVSKEARMRLRLNAEARGVKIGELVSVMALSLPETAAAAIAASSK